MARSLVLFIALVLGAASCADADDAGDDLDTTADEEATTESDSTTDVSEADEPATGGEVAAAPATCPTAPDIPDLAPVDGAAPFPIDGGGLDPGTYGSTGLGVAFAIDVPQGFEGAGSAGDRVSVFGPWDPTADAGAIFSVNRPEAFLADFRTDEEIELGVPSNIVDLSTWLVETGVEVISDESVTVAGRAARSVRFTVSADLVAAADPRGFGGLTLTADQIAFPGTFPHLAVEIELEVGAPLIIYASGPQDDFEATAATMLESLVIGEIGERPRVVFAETPWDVGNIFRPELVGACEIPAVAFDGVDFTLSAPALIQGTGDELWIFEPNGRHTGFRQPHVNIVRPDTTADGGGFGPPMPGEPVTSVDDVVAELEAEGFELTALGEVGTLLGSPALGFEFRVEGDDPWLWFPTGHAVSPGFGFASDEGNWHGVLWAAEVDGRVVVASAGAEIDTDDLDLVMPYFDDLTTTLTRRG